MVSIDTTRDTFDIAGTTPVSYTYANPYYTKSKPVKVESKEAKKTRLALEKTVLLGLYLMKEYLPLSRCLNQLIILINVDNENTDTKVKKISISLE